MPSPKIIVTVTSTSISVQRSKTRTLKHSSNLSLPFYLRHLKHTRRVTTRTTKQSSTAIAAHINNMEVPEKTRPSWSSIRLLTPPTQLSFTLVSENSIAKTIRNNVINPVRRPVHIRLKIAIPLFGRAGRNMDTFTPTALGPIALVTPLARRRLVLPPTALTLSPDTDAEKNTVVVTITYIIHTSPAWITWHRLTPTTPSTPTFLR